MATIIPTDRWPKPAEDFEPPYNLVWGISRETCGAERVMMARVIIPPGGGNQYHLHTRAEALGHVVRGRFRNELGGEVQDIAAGDFWHFMTNERHWSHNLSDTEICMMIASYVNCSTLEESGTIFLDPALAPALASVPKGQLPEPGVYGEPAQSRILKRASLEVETDPATGITTTWAVSRENSNTTGGISRLMVMPVGTATPFEAIENAETALFVLAGALSLETERQPARQEAPAGSFVYIPVGEAFRLTSVGETAAECYVVNSGVTHRNDLQLRQAEPAMA